MRNELVPHFQMQFLQFCVCHLPDLYQMQVCWTKAVHILIFYCILIIYFPSYFAKYTEYRKVLKIKIVDPNEIKLLCFVQILYVELF